MGERSTNPDANAATVRMTASSAKAVAAGATHPNRFVPFHEHRRRSGSKRDEQKGPGAVGTLPTEHLRGTATPGVELDRAHGVRSHETGQLGGAAASEADLRRAGCLNFSGHLFDGLGGHQVEARSPVARPDRELGQGRADIDACRGRPAERRIRFLNQLVTLPALVI